MVVKMNKGNYNQSKIQDGLFLDRNSNILIEQCVLCCLTLHAHQTHLLLIQSAYCQHLIVEPGCTTYNTVDK